MRDWGWSDHSDHTDHTDDLQKNQARFAASLDSVMKSPIEFAET